MIGCSSFFDLPEAAIEARGQKWTKIFVGGEQYCDVKIFIQTDFQKDWAKDKEMTGIFHLSLKNSAPNLSDSFVEPTLLPGQQPAAIQGSALRLEI